MVQHAQSSLYDRTTADYEAPRDVMVVTPSSAVATAPQFQWTREDLDALKATLSKDLTDSEFKVFIVAAQRLGLDPFAKQIYAWKDGGKLVIQVSIDGMRLNAERSRKYRGQVGPFWCGPDGEWKDVWLSEKLPVACKVGIKRSDFEETMWGVARYAAYAKTNTVWNKLGDVMIAKVAESLGLRKTFPDTLSGVYIPEEFGNTDFVEADPTPKQLADPAPRTHQTQPAPTAKAKAAPAAKATTAATMSVKDFCERVKVELGITPKQAMDELGVKSLAGLNLAQAYEQLANAPITQDEADEIGDPEYDIVFEEDTTAAPTITSLHIRANERGYTQAQWEKLLADTAGDPARIAAALDTAAQHDLHSLGSATGRH